MGITLFPWIGAPAEVQSLRRAAIQDESVPSEAWSYIDDDQLVPRGFAHQPPVIPHAVEGYRVNLRRNRCLSCHSLAKYKKKKATKISITHFRDREGNKLPDVAPTRYFCTQCHVPQADMPAPVENRFESVKTLETR